MVLKWTSKAHGDLLRLHAFLARRSRSAADHVARSLACAPKRLLERPRIGEALEEFEPREVRRLLVGKYEMRYEIRETVIVVLRIWHSREDR